MRGQQSLKYAERHGAQHFQWEPVPEVSRASTKGAHSVSSHLTWRPVPMELQHLSAVQHGHLQLWIRRWQHESGCRCAGQHPVVAAVQGGGMADQHDRWHW